MRIFPGEWWENKGERQERLWKKKNAAVATIKQKSSSEKEYKDLIHRLNRIEGQIRGIKGMVEKDAYCPDILIQVAAANAALNSLIRSFLQIISTCVAEDIRAGKDEVSMNW